MCWFWPTKKAPTPTNKIRNGKRSIVRAGGKETRKEHHHSEKVDPDKLISCEEALWRRFSISCVRSKVIVMVTAKMALTIAGAWDIRSHKAWSVTLRSADWLPLRQGARTGFGIWCVSLQTLVKVIVFKCRARMLWRRYFPGSLLHRITLSLWPSGIEHGTMRLWEVWFLTLAWTMVGRSSPLLWSSWPSLLLRCRQFLAERLVCVRIENLHFIFSTCLVVTTWASNWHRRENFRPQIVPVNK